MTGVFPDAIAAPRADPVQTQKAEERDDPDPSQAPMNPRSEKRLADETFHAYVEWLDESEAVWDAYDRWTSAAHADAGLAFGAYRAALEREEHASNVYAALMTRIPSGAHIAAELVRPHRSASKVTDPWRP
jgi:hypothetical protein